MRERLYTYISIRRSRIGKMRRIVPSRLYPSGLRPFRNSRRFSSSSTSRLSGSSGIWSVSSRNLMNIGRNTFRSRWYVTFRSKRMWPLRTFTPGR